ncbi:MAG: RDD family protein [Bacteroidetes bacterium]|nr:RDD family protein [Bacteroidota bacterium]
MQNIEITTTQNVTIQYELAPVWSRYVGGIIDALIILISCLFLFYILEEAKADYEIAWYLTIAPTVLFYSLFFENVLHGSSPGKLLMGNKIIRIDGKEPVFTDFLIRWTFRWIDIYGSITGCGLLTMLTSQNNQRLGDLLGNTTVVSLGKRRRIKLDNLMKFDDLSNYEAKYPQVLQLSEQEMLLLKDVATRYVKFKNAAHDQLLTEAIALVAEKLKIKPQSDRVAFVRTLIKDYVVLSR